MGIQEGQRWLTRGGFEVFIKETDVNTNLALVTLESDPDDWYSVSLSTGKEGYPYELPGDLIRELT